MDNIPGTNGDDVILGDSGTINAADTLKGNGGFDEAKLSLNAANASLNSSEVEKFSIQSLDDAASFNAVNVTGAQEWWSSNSTHDLTVSNVASLATVGVKGGVQGKNFTVEFADSVLAGSADTVNIALDSAKVNVLTAARTTDTTGVEAYAIQATGKSEVTTLTTSAATKSVTIAGDGDVKITNAIENAVTIDAAAATGAVTVGSGVAKVNITTGSGKDTVTLAHGDGAAGDQGIDKDVRVSTGAGDDKVVINALGADDTINKAAVIDAGEGKDTLSVTNGGWISSRDVGKVFRGFEVVDVTGGQGIYELDHLRDNNAFESLVVGALAADVTVNNLAKGASVTVNASAGAGNDLTVNVKGAGDAGSTNDVLSFTIGGKADVDAQTITAANIETVNIASVSTKEGGNTDNSIGVLIVADATTLTLTGAEQLTISAFTNSANLGLIDASAMTDKFIMGAADQSGNVTLIKGGSAADTLLTNAIAGSTVIGGAGADAITLHNSTTVSQIVKFEGQSDSTATAFDSVKNFAVGTGANATEIATNSDKLDLKFASITNDALKAVAETTKATVTGAGDASTAAFEISAANATSFFTNSAVQTGVVYAADGTDGAFVFVDVNADGQWNAEADLVVHLIGDFSGGLTVDNFIF